MSQHMKRQRALEDYKQFIFRLLASQARHVELTEPDVHEAVLTTTVKRKKVLAKFLALHPEHAEFRAQLSREFSVHDEFSFAIERWNDAIKLATC